MILHKPKYWELYAFSLPEDSPLKFGISQIQLHFGMSNPATRTHVTPSVSLWDLCLKLSVHEFKLRFRLHTSLHKHSMLSCEQVLHIQYVAHVVLLQVASGWRPDGRFLCTTERKTGDLAACEVCSTQTSESNNWLHRLIKSRETDRNGEREDEGERQLLLSRLELKAPLSLSLSSALNCVLSCWEQ